MGWNSGADIFNLVANQLERQFGSDDNPCVTVLRSRKSAVLFHLIESLEEQDCDVLDESFGVSAAGDLALVRAGYHNYKRESCRWYDTQAYEPEECSCGWKERS